MLKLCILSDLHIMEAGTSRDLDTKGRLGRAVDHINTTYSDAHLVIVAGDLIDRSAPDAYPVVKAALDRLTVPWTPTLGNHDRRALFRQTFSDSFLDRAVYAQSAHQVGGHHVIVLDTAHYPNGEAEHGAPYGTLDQVQLSWLDARLAEAKNAPVIVVSHHPVCPTFTRIDPYGLLDAAPLIDRLVAHGNVRQVISGHIHMTTTTYHRGIAFTTLAGAFSTSVEAFGQQLNRHRREGPAQMAVVLSDATQTTVHFDNYVDAHPLITGR